MATSTKQTTDVAQALASVLGDVEGLRVFSYVPDTAKAPCVVIGQPSIDFTDQGAGFCTATWFFPLNIVTTRSNERAAQSEMSQLLLDIVTALDADVEGIFSIEPQDARPINVAIGGQEHPGYLLNVRVRA